MKKFSFVIFVFLLLSLLTACSPGATPEETTLEVVHLQTTPALAHWLPKAADCAGAIPNLGLASEILEPSGLNLGSADLILRLGGPQEDDPYTAVMGMESLVLVAGDQVPLNTLSLDSLQSIFFGEWTRWSDVPESENAGDTELPLILFSYPNDNELEGLFSQTYLGGKPIPGNPQRYSSADGLADLLSTAPYGLGYTLASQVPVGFRAIEISDLEQDPAFYVLAVTAGEPESGLEQLLLCLQNPE